MLQDVGFTYFGTPPANLPKPPAFPGDDGKTLKVYIGFSKCTKQYDSWLSFTGNGGGSELKYSRGDGYLKFVDDHVTDFQDIISVNHSRSDIRSRKALYVLSSWDFQWEKENFEQYFAIWEEDTKGTLNFKFNLGTTVTLSPGNPASTGTGSIGFEITKKSQDAIIRQFEISRYSYFTDARQDQGHGFLIGYDVTRNGWCNWVLTYRYDYSFLQENSESPWPTYDWNSDQKSVGWTWPYKRI